jgi:hypothetical protein
MVQAVWDSARTSLKLTFRKFGGFEYSEVKVTVFILEIESDESVFTIVGSWDLVSFGFVFFGAETHAFEVPILRQRGAFPGHSLVTPGCFLKELQMLLAGGPTPIVSFENCHWMSAMTQNI